MRNNNAPQLSDPQKQGLVVDPSLDALFAGKVLFPHKMQKIRKLYENRSKQKDA